MVVKIIEKFLELILFDIFYWCGFRDFGYVVMVCKKWWWIVYDYLFWRDVDLCGLKLIERILVLIDWIFLFVFMMNISGCVVIVLFIMVIVEKCINLKILR